MTNQHVLVHLNLINGIGPATIACIYEQSVKNERALKFVYGLSVTDWRALGVSEKNSQLLVQGLKDRRALDAELELVARYGFTVTTLADQDYPEMLRNCYALPPVLYWQGSVFVSEREVSVRPEFIEGCERKKFVSLAIVGSRAGNAYAKTFIGSVMPELVNSQICIVSGGALGVDTMAHEAALKNGLCTIGVLGTGLLRPYPTRNKDLFDKMVDAGGAIVSSFSLMTGPDQWNFPARNRIIAGLSTGVLVVQAAKKSGTQSTVQFALDYGRHVLAVPGLYNDELSAGCNALIAQGAVVATCAQDILSTLGVSVPAQESNVVARTKIPEQKTSCDPILCACQKESSFDEIVCNTGLPAETVRERLFQLQLAGLVEQNFVGKFKAIN